MKLISNKILAIFKWKYPNKLLLKNKNRTIYPPRDIVIYRWVSARSQVQVTPLQNYCEVGLNLKKKYKKE